jgi:hypothetical protein
MADLHPNHSPKKAQRDSHKAMKHESYRHPLGALGILSQLVLLWACYPLNAQILQIQIVVTGDFLLKNTWEPPQLSRWVADKEVDYRISDANILQTALSDLADREQEANRKLREMRWLEIKSLENVQYILDIQHEPWWVRAPTVRFLSDGAGSLVESTTISSYPATLQARRVTEECDTPLKHAAPGKKYSAWIGYPAEGNGKILLCYII